MSNCYNEVEIILEESCSACIHNKVCGLKDKFKSFVGYVNNIECDSENFKIEPKCLRFKYDLYLVKSPWITHGHWIIADD